MIIGARWRRSRGGSGRGRPGVICRRSSGRGSRRGSGIVAGRSMALTRRCSMRCVPTQWSRMSRRRVWCRLTRRVCVSTSMRLGAASTGSQRSQGARSNYKDLPGEPPDHALGRSRGGWTTKIHALTDEWCSPLTLQLTAGQAGDNPMLVPLIGAHRDQRGFRLLADKAYSHPSTRAWLRTAKIAHTIPERRDQSRTAKPKAHAAGDHQASIPTPTDTAIPPSAASTDSSTGAASPPATTNTP
jgi:putative transposase